MNPNRLPFLPVGGDWSNSGLLGASQSSSSGQPLFLNFLPRENSPDLAALHALQNDPNLRNSMLLYNNMKVEEAARNAQQTSELQSRLARPSSSLPTSAAKPAPPAASIAPKRDPAQMSKQSIQEYDALEYLNQVRLRFAHEPPVYNAFLNIMKEFKSQEISTSAVTAKVSKLFAGHQDLVQGFNNFLPPAEQAQAREQSNQERSFQPPAGSQASRVSAPPSFIQHPKVAKPAEQAVKKDKKPKSSGGESHGQAAQVPQSEDRDSAFTYVARIRARFEHRPNVYREFLEVLQKYKQNVYDISRVKGEVTRLFDGHPDLLRQFSIFLPDDYHDESQGKGEASKSKGSHSSTHGKKQDQKMSEKGSADGAADKSDRTDGQDRNVADKSNDKSGGKSSSKKKPKVEKEKPWEPEPDDVNGQLLYTIGKELRQGGVDKQNDFLKCLDLHVEGVLSAEELVTVVHESMISTSNLKKLYGPFKAMIGAKQSETLPISELDFSHCPRSGVSYRKLPKDYIPPLCSSRTPFQDSVLNDDWVSLANGREDFLHMKRTQYEIAMFLCEDDRYELDMLIEANISTIRAIKAKIAEYEGKQERSDGVNSSNGSTSKEPGVEVQARSMGEALKPRHMKIIQMVYADHWPEIAHNLFRRAPVTTLNVVLKRLEHKDAEWRKTRRDMNKIWSQVYLKNYHKSLDYRSFQFKQADKKALSQQSLAQEAKIVRRQASLQPTLSPCLKFLMPDQEVHDDIFSILLLSLPNDALPSLADRVEQFFKRFLHVFLGFRKRDYEEIVRSVSAANVQASSDSQVQVTGSDDPSASAAGDQDNGMSGYGEFVEEEEEEKAISQEAILDESSMDVEEFEHRREHAGRRLSAAGKENGGSEDRAESKGTEEQVEDVLEEVIKAVSGDSLESGKQLSSIEDLDVAMMNVVKQAAEAVSKGTDESVYRSLFPSPTTFFEPEVEGKKEERSTRESRSKARARELGVNESDVDYTSSYKPPVDSYQAPTYVPPVAEEEKEEEKVKDVCKEDIWQTVYTFPDFSPLSLRDLPSERSSSQVAGAEPEETSILYGNLKCYYFFRLYQKMYERLTKAKELAQTQDDRLRRDEEEKAEELLRKAMSSQDVSQDADAASAAGDGMKGMPGSTYKTFMDMVARLVKGTLDSADFEEGCRVTLGTSSYEVFTLEWLSDQLLRLARALAGEDAKSPNGGSCFVSLFEYQHLQNGGFGPVYEANARRLAGSGDCYAFFYDRTSASLSISLHLVDTPESKDLREREKSDRVQSPSEEEHPDEAEDESKVLVPLLMGRNVRAGSKALGDAVVGVYERSELVVHANGGEHEFEAHTSDGMWRSKKMRSNRKEYNIHRRSAKLRKWQEEHVEQLVAQEEMEMRMKNANDDRRSAALLRMLDDAMDRELMGNKDSNLISNSNSVAGTPHSGWEEEEEEDGEKEEQDEEKEDEGGKEEDEAKKEEGEGQEGPVTRKRRLNLQGEESRSVSASPAPRERRRIVFVCRKSDEEAAAAAARKAEEAASAAQEDGEKRKEEGEKEEEEGGKEEGKGKEAELNLIAELSVAQFESYRKQMLKRSPPEPEELAEGMAAEMEGAKAAKRSEKDSPRG